MITIAGNPTVDIIITTGGTLRRYGGPIYYATMALSELGIKARAVGVASQEDIQQLTAYFRSRGVEAQLIPADATTTFELDYRTKPRKVRLLRKPSIGIPEVSGDVVILSPVYDELQNTIIRSRAIVADLQGYLRSGLALPAADLVHFSIDDMELSLDALVKFAARWPVTVYTLGEDGTYVVFERGIYHINSARIAVKDATGSGDIFLAVLVYMYNVKGLELLDAVCEASMYVAGFLNTGRIVRHEYECRRQKIKGLTSATAGKGRNA